jgi:hypothetical protein
VLVIVLLSDEGGRLDREEESLLWVVIVLVVDLGADDVVGVLCGMVLEESRAFREPRPLVGSPNHVPSIDIPNGGLSQCLE